MRMIKIGMGGRFRLLRFAAPALVRECLAQLISPCVQGHAELVAKKLPRGLVMAECVRSFAESSQTPDGLPMRLFAERIQFQRSARVCKCVVEMASIELQTGNPDRRANDRVEKLAAPGTKPILEVGRAEGLSLEEGTLVKRDRLNRRLLIARCDGAPEFADVGPQECFIEMEVALPVADNCVRADSLPSNIQGLP